MESILAEERSVYRRICDIIPVHELSHETTLDYVVSTMKRTLLPIIEEHDVIIMAGGYFGDEGKGKITDVIARSPLIEIVFRDNSGENAGHTVEDKRKRLKMIFNLTPSGILVPHIKNFIGAECVMDPVNYMEKEISQLVKNGINYKERLFVGNVHIVGPHHKIMDFALSPQNTSTLQGMSYVHASKVMKRGLRLDDLYNSQDDQRKKIEKDLEVYFAMLNHRGISEKDIAKGLKELQKDRKVPQHLFGFLAAKDKADYVINLYRESVVENPDFPLRANATHAVRQVLARGGKVAVESPQSYWLSNATETHWSSSTSAQTHAAGVLASSGINLVKYRVAVINVVKTPADSRVGVGSNPSSFVPQNWFSQRKINKLDDLGKRCMDFDRIQKQYFESIGANGILEPTEFTDNTGTYSISEAMAIASSRFFRERGATTGKPRVTGIFDCLAAYHVNQAQGPYLTISAMDRGDHQDFVGMTVAYIYHDPQGKVRDSNGKKYQNGDLIRIGDEYPGDNVLKYCHPIVKVMPGWKETPIGAEHGRKRSLPKNTRNFIGTIEDLTGFNVIAIGNGPKNTDLIYIKRK